MNLPSPFGDRFPESQITVGSNEKPRKKRKTKSVLILSTSESEIESEEEIPQKKNILVSKKTVLEETLKSIYTEQVGDTTRNPILKNIDFESILKSKAPEKTLFETVPFLKNKQPPFQIGVVTNKIFLRNLDKGITRGMLDELLFSYCEFRKVSRFVFGKSS